MSLAPTRQDEPPLADFHPKLHSFREDFLTGMRREPRELSPKYFYDAEGSRLFDRICTLEEYFPTRTEIAILKENSREMRDAVGKRRRIVEFGSGNATKTRLLLQGLDEPSVYIPVEISKTCLRNSARQLAREFPQLEILPVCADYTQPFDLPQSDQEFDGTVIFFPGSTIGNLHRKQAIQFLRNARQSCGECCGLLIGAALQTEPRILERAYNDSLGITATFNRNVLWRAKRELGAQLDPEAFRHEAVYNEVMGRIEMRLVSEREQTIDLDDERFHFSPGDAIITEYSQKYTIEGLTQLALEAGFNPKRVWTDDRNLFSVHYLDTTSTSK